MAGMSFTVRLAAEVVPVDPGATAPVVVEIVNRGEQAEEIEVQFEGLDVEWTAVPTPVLTVGPQESISERLYLKPPRVSESVAGAYPFAVRARSLVDGESRTVQGVLEIRPYNHLSVDALPKRGVVTAFSRQVAFEVTVMNLGNSEVSLQMFATDTDEACAYEFSQDKFSLAPGQQKTVEAVCSPRRRSLFSNSRLHIVTISARTLETPTSAGSTQVQVEQRAALTPLTLLAGLLFVAFAFAWWWTYPRPPVIDSFALDRQEVTVGEPVRVSWGTTRARSVTLRVGDKTIERLANNGSYTFTPEAAGTLLVELVARYEGRRSGPETRSLVVMEPVKVPAPRILEFKITPTSLNVGQTFSVSYKLSPSVTKATLSPPGLTLDPMVPEIELEAQRPGEIVYRLIAVNSAGARDEKTVKVKVVEGPEVSIVVFSVDRTKVTPDEPAVRITWQLERAARAEILGLGEPMQIEPKGTLDVELTKTTTLILKGYDSKGRTITRELKVEFVAPPPPDPPVSDPAGDPASTTGGGG